LASLFLEEAMPTPLNERNPGNHDGDWAKIFAAFCFSVTLLAAVVAVAARYPLAGKWISDAVQAEFVDPNAPLDDKTAEQPRNVAHAAKIK
jgi:hypothetical protein